MKKLTLELEALTVDSFDTAATPAGRGTVEGALNTHRMCVTDEYLSCGGTCDINCSQKCGSDHTCHVSCNGTCYVSCNGTCGGAACATWGGDTCYVSCPNGMTCYGMEC